MKIKTTAPGKLILLGEYAVLEGAPAIVSAVDRFAMVTLNSLDGLNFKFSSPTLDIKDLMFFFQDSGKVQFTGKNLEKIKPKLTFIKSALEHFNNRYNFFSIIKPFEITADTTHFYQDKAKEKFGLGSSSAMTVALWGALFRFQNTHKRLDKKKIFEEARALHFAAQGNRGSGIDIAASVYGGMLQYQILTDLKKPETIFITPTQLPLGIYIIPVWTKESASTRSLVGKVQNFKRTKPAKYFSLMEKFQHLCREGCQSFFNGKVDNFLQICADYFILLDELSKQSEADIISREHREIAKITNKLGAVYKPSGAGGGDLGIAITDSLTISNKIKQAILFSKYEVINLNFCKRGLTIEKSYSN
jgi:phosphomevalonate kinase